jgi:hypothetical protein
MMWRLRSILLTIATAIGGFLGTQLVIYGIFCIIGWRMSLRDTSIGAGELVGYGYLAWALFVGVPVGIGVGVLAASFVGPRTWQPRRASAPASR